jgi:hypothetical protein
MPDSIMGESHAKFNSNRNAKMGVYGEAITRRAAYTIGLNDINGR